MSDYRIQFGERADESFWLEMFGPNKSHVLTDWLGSREQISHIAKCVNNHQKLVDALTLIAGEHPTKRRLTYKEQTELASSILAALEDVKGKGK